MKVMAVLSVSLSKNIDKRMEKEYTLIDKVFFDLTVMSTDQEEKKEAIKISGVVMSVKILGTGSFLPEKSCLLVSGHITLQNIPAFLRQGTSAA